jgi:hypothetical protein
MATTRTRKQTPAQPDTTTPAAKTPARKTTPAKKAPARKPAAKKTAAPATQPKRKQERGWMTDAQGFAVLAARIAGINTDRIQDWRDHGDGTVTRALDDGTLLYKVATRTLRWQATCCMGAVHTYRIDDASMAAAARTRAATCPLLHADFSTLKGLTDEELAELGVHTGITLVKQPPSEDPDTETFTVLLPVKVRALGDTLTRATTATDDTQPLPVTEIAAGLTARADTEEAKEHPQP